MFKWNAREQSIKFILGSRGAQCAPGKRKEEEQIMFQKDRRKKYERKVIK